MAVGLLHEPEILFLDEPTSGTDPLKRREFWRRITALVASGHDHHHHHPLHGRSRVLRPHRDPGRRQAAGAGHAARKCGVQAGEEEAGRLTMEEAFIGIVEQAGKTRQQLRSQAIEW